MLAKPQLLCLTIYGDTIARSHAFPFKPTGLFLDCLGYLHVLSRDSAYQVYTRGNKALIAYSSGLERFKSVMSNCVTSTEKYLFFRWESKDKLSIDFYGINRKTKQSVPLAQVL